MVLPSTQEGVEGYRRGSLIRKLKPIVVATLTAGASPTVTGVLTTNVTLKNLSADLNVHIAAVIEGAEGTKIIPDTTIDPNFPVNPGTMQIWLVTRYPETGRCILRPVFQDPTQTPLDNKNHPLAADIPIGWEGETSADELDIQTVITTVNWANTGYNGRILIEASVAYDGAWQDAGAITYALSRVQFIGVPSNPGIIGTTPT